MLLKAKPKVAAGNSFARRITEEEYPMDRWVRCLSVMLLLLATVFAAGSAAAQDVRRYIYAAVPGECQCGKHWWDGEVPN